MAGAHEILALENVQREPGAVWRLAKVHLRPGQLLRDLALDEQDPCLWGGISRYIRYGRYRLGRFRLSCNGCNRCNAAYPCRQVALESLCKVLKLVTL